jgi:inorganic pyrophosphatase
MNRDPIKFEIDKQRSAIFVERFMSTTMRYPCSDGHIPHTLS